MGMFWSISLMTYIVKQQSRVSEVRDACLRILHETNLLKHSGDFIFI